MRGRHDLANSSWRHVKGTGGDGPAGGDAGSGSGGNNPTGNKAEISAATIVAAGGIVAAIIAGIFLIIATKGSGGGRSDGPSSPPPPATPTAVPSTPPSDVPAKFAGTWSGTQTQFEAPFNYPTTITIFTGRIDEKIGAADYPSLPCRFALKLITSTPELINVEASVISGDCTAPEMRFAVDGSDSLKYNLYYGDKRVGYGNVSRSYR